MPEGIHSGTSSMTELPTPSTEWSSYESYFREPETAELSSANFGAWLSAWSDIEKLIRGLEIQLKVAAYADLTDEAAQKAFDRYSEHLSPNVKNANQILKQMFLEAVKEEPPKRVLSKSAIQPSGSMALCQNQEQYTRQT